uniref:Serine/arginine repetitive matrix protein C-terminal domain-containing protein n=1 Tax=Eptatretus burgeri TaxID=7764 RepID=A0A8C4N8U5_EPTBU
MAEALPGTLPCFPHSPHLKSRSSLEGDCSGSRGREEKVESVRLGRGVFIEELGIKGKDAEGRLCPPLEISKDQNLVGISGEISMKSHTIQHIEHKETFRKKMSGTGGCSKGTKEDRLREESAGSCIGCRTQLLGHDCSKGKKSKGDERTVRDFGFDQPGVETVEQVSSMCNSCDLSPDCLVRIEEKCQELQAVLMENGRPPEKVRAKVDALRRLLLLQARTSSAGSHDFENRDEIQEDEELLTRHSPSASPKHRKRKYKRKRNKKSGSSRKKKRRKSRLSSHSFPKDQSSGSSAVGHKPEAHSVDGGQRLAGRNNVMTHDITEGKDSCAGKAGPVTWETLKKGPAKPAVPPSLRSHTTSTAHSHSEDSGSERRHSRRGQGWHSDKSPSSSRSFPSPSIRVTPSPSHSPPSLARRPLGRESRRRSRSRQRDRGMARGQGARASGRRSYSPPRKRRRSSPSYLEPRRITSARKRPIPYYRPSPPTPVSSSTSSSCSSSTYSSYSSLSPLRSRRRRRHRSHSRCSSVRSRSLSSSSRSHSFDSHSRSFDSRSRSRSWYDPIPCSSEWQGGVDGKGTIGAREVGNRSFVRGLRGGVKGGGKGRAFNLHY